MQFVACQFHGGFGEFSADDLTLGCIYEVITPADNHGMIRIIDDSGEDYLYPARFFQDIANQPEAIRAIDSGLIKRMRALTKGVQVDLESALDPADE